ncbi:NAD(P)-dependent dehydrogenase (short-subunit alcohol dehydrogenase family) [Nocardioides zeae]|uniref:NAD(P)-dependent dehydrogenase (Short-subunit alcohol dehydrogenase family) n=1 Tax=Nocardioides zeae TaxID=1457234 RepID=A0ACC6IJW9_9ACTN|nr:SDR family oxidoreductase [Nocardioides zeae]MDR6173574.1 NAD(P)-dependent dehydrogenase (short-subunit alcohol dehydrogenase family) [Nocardioides zeae]MDR6210979.1 NAD(P)-dependent dehydrogenase (short-subunit alcohol dehydrogenase family) [Nocardioides zeae]
MRIAGGLAVVTGAASGIGAHVASEVVRRGGRVVVADRDRAGAEQHAASLAGAHAAEVDVTDAAACTTLAADVHALHGPVDLLVANAGLIRPGSTWTTPLSTWRTVLDVNLLGAVHTLAAFLPDMVERDRPAAVVLTASVAGLTAAPGFAAYAASKHAVVGLAEGLQVELAEAGADHVRVSVVCPGGVDTAIWRSAGPAAPGLDEVARRRFAAVGGPRTDQADPAAIARLTLDAVEEGRSWVVPIEPHHREALASRAHDLAAAAAADGGLVYGR